MIAEATEFRGAARGGVRLLLRLEGLAVFLASLVFYKMVHGHWGTFALLFLAPDLAFLFYAVRRSLGTIAYNAAHSYVLPIALLCAGTLHSALLPYALVWTAHIGFDRTLGYGLKYKTDFGDTHLGRLGKAASEKV